MSYLQAAIYNLYHFTSQKSHYNWLKPKKKKNGAQPYNIGVKKCLIANFCYMIFSITYVTFQQGIWGSRIVIYT